MNVPVKLYFQKQVTGWIQPMGHSFLTSGLRQCCQVELCTGWKYSKSEIPSLVTSVWLVLLRIWINFVLFTFKYAHVGSDYRIGYCMVLFCQSWQTPDHLIMFLSTCLSQVLIHWKAQCWKQWKWEQHMFCLHSEADSFPFAFGVDSWASYIWRGPAIISHWACSSGWKALRHVFHELQCLCQ